MFTILAAFLVFIDVAMDGLVAWSLVAILGLAFLAGGIMILQFLASADRSDRRPFLTGATLLVASVVLLPVTLAYQSTATWTESFTIPYDPSIRTILLGVTDDVGQVRVDFAASSSFLVRAEVVHVGGLFTSHSVGDVVPTNSTSLDTLSFHLTARGVPGLLFVGGHDVRVTLNRNLSVSLDLQSTTGSVAIDIPADVEVRSITATVTTGSVTMVSRNASYVNGATVRATSTTGSVALELVQDAGSPGTVGVRGSSAAGRVTFRLTRGPDVAAQVQASVPTGSIGYDPSKYQGTESLLYAPSLVGYETARLKFDVQLTSTTGSIEIG